MSDTDLAKAIAGKWPQYKSILAPMLTPPAPLPQAEAIRETGGYLVKQPGQLPKHVFLPYGSKVTPEEASKTASKWSQTPAGVKLEDRVEEAMRRAEERNKARYVGPIGESPMLGLAKYYSRQLAPKKPDKIERGLFGDLPQSQEELWRSLGVHPNMTWREKLDVLGRWSMMGPILHGPKFLGTSPKELPAPETIEMVEPPPKPDVVTKEMRQLRVIRGMEASRSEVPEPIYGPDTPSKAWGRWMDRFWSHMPQDLPIATRKPESGVISETDRHTTMIGEDFLKFLKEPWFNKLRLEHDPNYFVDSEDNAFQVYKAALVSGKTDEQAFMEAVNTLPSDIKAEALDLRAIRPAEKWAVDFLRHEPLKDEPAYFLPHETVKDYTDSISVDRAFENWRADVRTTLSGFEKPRKYATMKAGIAAKEKYVDPRLAIIHRKWASLKLIHTAKLIERLEKQGIIYRDREDLLRVHPGVTPQRVSNIPGAREWWAPSKEEARHVTNWLQAPQTSRFAKLVSWGNRFFRSPNLVLPLPHRYKNMYFKYWLTGGKILKLRPYMRLYATHPEDPRVKLFKEVMPQWEMGQTPSQLLHQTLTDIEKERSLYYYLNQKYNPLLKAQDWSQRKVFRDWDPAIKFARWQVYMDKGMPPQEAANNVRVDLINYGMRGDWIDFWKSWPLNFYAPWRTGTALSLMKMAATKPVRTAIYIGAFDYLREIMLRKTGYWFHSPIDYFEGPASRAEQAFKQKGVVAAAQQLGATGILTILFGPGGSGVLQDAIVGSLNRGDLLTYNEIKRVFWGLTWMLDEFQPGGAADELYKFERDGNPQHFANAFGMLSARIILGAYDTRQRKTPPHRLLQDLPQDLPGMKKGYGF